MQYAKQTKTLLILSGCLALSACGNTLDRLETMGREPPMAKIENPTMQPGYQPVSWPSPQPKADTPRGANSLWQPGSKAFFRDQRARNVGDVLTVMVKINDLARVNNTTEAKRTGDDSLSAGNIFGLEDNIAGAVSSQAVPSALLNMNSNHNSKGDGTIDRREQIETALAATVTQVLPNGNLVISGRQQIRINYEMREMGVDGVVRPEDISSDNKVDSSKIAEARINYGGKGTLSDIQQPRYGQQLIDILSPF
ncbi:flagellar basal body L-ring protein FlgH [bacterium]|nr:flagellar basal body L-ring protein FlgH [bacterium]